MKNIKCDWNPMHKTAAGNPAFKDTDCKKEALYRVGTFNLCEECSDKFKAPRRVLTQDILDKD